MKTAKVFRKTPKRLLKVFIAISSLNSSKKGERQHRVILKLYELIFSREDISFEDLQDQLDIIDNITQLRKDLHEILENLLVFLAKEVVQQDTLLLQSQILKIIDLYGIDNVINEHYIKTLKIISEKAINSEELIDSYQIMKFGFERNISITSVNEKFNAKGIEELLELQNDLSDFHEIESIKIGLIQYNIYFQKNLKESTNLITQNIIRENKTKNELLKLYRYLYILVSSVSSDIQKINILINQLGNNQIVNDLDFKTLSDGLSNLLNYSKNKGVQGLEKAQFELIKLGIKREDYRKSIETLIYRNIIYIACSVKEYEWALKFSEDYNSKLPLDERSTAYSFNKARIYINMKHYEDVITTLRDVEYKDTTYNLNSKLMLMVSFYELDEYEPLLSTIRAFKVFLRRRRNVSVARKANFTGFCDALYNIMLAEENRDIKRIRKAKEIIDGNPAIPNTGWLKEKLEELKL